MFYKKLIKQQLYKRGWAPTGSSQLINEAPETIYHSAVPEEGIIYSYRDNETVTDWDSSVLQIDRETIESPDFESLNQAVSCFIKGAKTIVNIDSKTGIFESFASVDKSLSFISLISGEGNLEWCKKNRQKENIVYCNKSPKELIAEENKFDLAIAIDVINHISDFGYFLSDLSKLSDRAIISTSNKDRSLKTALANIPEDNSIFREWDAGEFYWVLKSFYNKVQLYAMPDPYIPVVKEVGIMSTLSPLIAVCS